MKRERGGGGRGERERERERGRGGADKQTDRHTGKSGSFSDPFNPVHPTAPISQLRPNHPLPDWH